jgi:tetratricopeptide (TPR) repeat protein
MKKRRKCFHLLMVILGSTMPVLAQDADRLLKTAQRFEQLGEIDLAIGTLQDAARLTPDNPEIQKVLARQYLSKINDTAGTGNKKHYAQMALDLAQKAAEKLPEDSAAHVGLAAAYGKGCEFVDPKTRAEYSRKIYAEANRALQLDPTSDFGHLILARWNFQMATLNPLMKGIAQMVYGRLPAASREEAILHFKKAIELAPGRITHHAEYAEALELMGDRAGARQQWTKVTALKPISAQDRRYELEAVERGKSS